MTNIFRGNQTAGFLIMSGLIIVNLINLSTSIQTESYLQSSAKLKATVLKYRQEAGRI